MRQMFIPLANLAVTIEAAQTSLPAPTAAGDGADVTGWRSGSFRPLQGDVAFTAAGSVTLQSAELFELVDGVWYSLGLLNNGNDIVLTATKGFRHPFYAARGDRLALGATLSAAVAVTVVATPHEVTT